jgi:asparagine synthase (glutamine-hydrolysing)
VLRSRAAGTNAAAMCGLGVVMSLDGTPVPHLRAALRGMNELLAHRGPDGSGEWIHPAEHVGFTHRRLSIIDLERGDQPMTDGGGNWIAYNGEIYNDRTLRGELGERRFVTDSDTEVILRSYRALGPACLDRLRGMFAFALWDEEREELLLARDRFGIKPLYYTVVDGVLYTASESKALLPFLPAIETDQRGLAEYLTFQFPLAGRTLYKGVFELPGAHLLRVRDGAVNVRRWWEVSYEHDLDHSERYFVRRLREIVAESVERHLVSDVPVGAYVSGGLDSSIVAATAARVVEEPFLGFTGRFDAGPPYDEAPYARAAAESSGFELRETTIRPDDLVEHVGRLVYHLDFPVAGPGSFPQYLVSRDAARERKVVLGGQGGDEIFGGYARYLLAYFEQCIKAAIEGTSRRAQFIVTYESIIPNLESLRAYKPLIQSFWREGVFGDLDERYFRLVNRAHDLDGIVRPELVAEHGPYEAFAEIFHARNVPDDSYFDLMTHFDFKTLLPALLQVEDRVSMAHGLESRTPLVDHEVVEFAAALPALVKFKNGELKRTLKLAFHDLLPGTIVDRKDKAGFPVPLTEWARGPLRDFVLDTFAGAGGRRDYLLDGFSAERLLAAETGFGRSLWGLLSLELWQQQFHDRAAHWRELRGRMTSAEAYAETGAR